ncbi:MAG TPA: diguanylate cyclase [Paucimonas sp.]|nr:diguanylate cyclase [Paucimonas sp.]HJW54587.1 diguanylate cyclase [Burkholderiaceae bacterium]
MISADATPGLQHFLLDGVLQAVKVGVIVLDARQRIVLWNRWMEQHSPHPAAAVLGQQFVDVFPAMANGRTHAAIVSALTDNFASLISQSLNKAPFPLYYSEADEISNRRIQQAVQVMPIQVATLPRHCLVQITDVSIAVTRERKLRELALELQSQTFLDGLTGIANRRRFDVDINHEFRRAKRTGAPLSLVMIDVDSFKRYNDNYGHQQGDWCLAQIATALSRTLERSSDLLARYGGEEFMAILPDTDSHGALQIAEIMRAEIEALALPHAYSDVANHVTVSLGVVTQVPHQHAAIVHLIGAADRALYKAKSSGRNCVAVSDNHPVPLMQ